MPRRPSKKFLRMRTGHGTMDMLAVAPVRNSSGATAHEGAHLMRNALTLALAGVLAVCLPACDCNNAPPQNDGGRTDAGKVQSDSGIAPTDSGTATTDAGSGNTDAGTVDAGVIIVLPDGGSCSSDPGCIAASTSACDPAGTPSLGTCVDVGAGCLKVQTLVACPSALQACPAGATACTCPNTACAVGATTCSTGTSVGTCALDVAGGCGVFPSTGVACAAHQSCTGATPSAICSCDTDLLCAAGVGTSCNALNTGTITCALDANSCLFSSPSVACSTPKVCTGAAPASGCACPALAASPVVGGGCNSVGATACETGATNNILTCTATGGCNAWQLTTSCSASSLVCGSKSGSADCECGGNGTSTFYADPVGGSATGALPYPTGLASPAKCRFKTLTSALVQANAAGALGSGTVIATGQAGSGAATFDAETFPLTVNSNVTLTTADATPTPANYVIAFNDNAASRSAVVLHDLAHFTGFTIQNVSVAATSTGISTACASPSAGVSVVTGVAVNGKSTASANPSMANGLNVVSNCSVNVTGSTFAFTGFGVRLIATTDATTVAVSNSTLDSNFGIGALVTRGTLTFNTVNVKNSAGEGVRLSPVAGDVVFTDTGSTIESNAHEGLNIFAGGTAASTTTLTNTEIRNNGSSPGGPSTFAGITTTAARALTLTGVNVHQNAAAGLTASGGPTIVITGASHFDNNGTQTNTAPGLNATGAGTSVTATGATFNSNRGSGVHVGGLAVGTFDGITVTGNGAGQLAANRPGAFEVENGTATINTVKTATTITGNVFNGIKDSSGSLMISGTVLTPVDVGNNGVPSLTQPTPFNGAFVGGATFSATNVNFHDNGSHGVQVANTGANPIGQPIAITSSTFSKNGGAGLRVDVSSAISGTGANSLNVSGCVFTGNLHALNIAANLGDVHAAFQNNSFSGASDTAALVTGTAGSVLNFTNNVASNNKASTQYSGQGVGGFLFTGVAPGTFSFVSNQVHHNEANQVIVFGNGVATTWALNGTAGASCNAPTANVFACYNNSPTVSTSVGVAAIGAGVVVQANGNSWQNAAPAGGTDFSTANGAVFLPSPPSPVCPASTIACP